MSESLHQNKTFASEKDPSIPPLSTELLEKKCGPVAIEILSQDEKLRTSCIRALRSNAVVAASEVVFHQAGIEKAPEMHAKIVNGAMLGKTIRESGITQERTENEFHQTTTPPEFTNLFSTTKETCLSRKVDYVVAGTLYATIVEYYNPDYVVAEDFTKGEE
jgi:hypothetical protein